MKNIFKIGAACALGMSSFILASGTPVKAAACVDNLLGLLSTNNPCTDSQGYEFTFINSTGFNTSTTLGVGDQFAFQSAFGNFQYSLQAATAYTTTPGTYTLSYKVKAPTGKLLSQLTSGLQSTDNTASGSWTIVGTQGQAQTTLAAPLTATGGVYNYAPKLSEDTFTATLVVNSGNISTVGSMLKSAPKLSEVPGPLPIIGAGAAFGFSRKIRRRIQASA
ncbi:MAG: hypothetical protein NTW51_01305 [Cyanobacteria bacterium]|nr:hypothetical protein [Cyanobacteriota bacterium]